MLLKFAKDGNHTFFELFFSLYDDIKNKIAILSPVFDRFDWMFQWVHGIDFTHNDIRSCRCHYALALIRMFVRSIRIGIIVFLKKRITRIACFNAFKMFDRKVDIIEIAIRKWC